MENSFADTANHEMNIARTPLSSSKFDFNLRLMLQKTTNDQVKDFAHLMIKDQGDELEPMAQKQNLRLPKGLDSQSQSSLKRLQSESGMRLAEHIPGSFMAMPPFHNPFSFFASESLRL
jgi:predicted outer membrane protein